MRYLVPILAILVVIGCPKPDEDYPFPETNPQINIPWPSLADSPWPMHHHDPQSTGRSQYAGPQQGIIYKKVPMAASVSGISVGTDSTVYMSSYGYPYSFYCFDYEGNIKWESTFRSASTPIVGADNLVYAGGTEQFFAFTLEGDTLWHKSINYMTTLGVNIDKEGNLYFIDTGKNLVVLSNAGDVSWQLNDSRFLQWADAAPTFSPDGNTLYVQGDPVSILAVDLITQSVKWTFGDQGLYSAPVVDNDGNLLFSPGPNSLISGNRVFYSLDSDGDINWNFSYISRLLWDNSEPTIDYDGNIYFATDTLYSLNYRGELRWKFGFEDGYSNGSPLICDINNVVYAGVKHKSTGLNQVSAISSIGQVLWTVHNDEAGFLGTSPSISEIGTLFYPMWDQYPGNYLIIY